MKKRKLKDGTTGETLVAGSGWSESSVSYHLVLPKGVRPRSPCRASAGQDGRKSALAELCELSASPLADLIKMLDEPNATRKVEEAAHAKPKKPRSRKATKAVPIVAAKKRRSAGVNLPAKLKAQLKACRAGSKQAILIDHLAQGATLAELVAALAPWTESSVKSALYWDVAKVKGYGVRTETADDGTQRYHLTSSRPRSGWPPTAANENTRRLLAEARRY